MRWVVGIDEAGRGPLAGPVAVGVFAMPTDLDPGLLAGIKDSKVLSARQREAWYGRLRAIAEARMAVALIGAPHIDRRGIVHAIRQGMARALRRIDCDPAACVVLLDGGLHAPEEYRDQTTIIRGDASEPVIAAAAILAKVTRDRYMLRQATRYPLHGFTEHKGYGTAAHRAAIKEHGLSPLHRKTFCSRVND